MERRPRGQFFTWQDPPPQAHDDWWSGPLHAIAIVLLLILLVAGVVWLLRRLSPQVAQATSPALVPAAAGGAALADDPAVALLRMRYARGEVSRDDYRNAIEDLGGVATPTQDWPGETEETAADEAQPPPQPE